MDIFLKIIKTVLITGLVTILLPQAGFCQTCVNPLDVCGGSEHKKCCEEVDGKKYECKSTDGVTINVDESAEMGSCEEKKEE